MATQQARARAPSIHMLQSFARVRTASYFSAAQFVQNKVINTAPSTATNINWTQSSTAPRQYYSTQIRDNKLQRRLPHHHNIRRFYSKRFTSDDENFICIRRFSSNANDAKKDDDEDAKKDDDEDVKKDDDEDTKKDEDEPTKKKKGTADLRDSVNRLKGDNTETGSDNGDDDANNESSFAGTARSWMSVFSDEVSQTWQELLNSGQPKGINKKIVTDTDTYPDATATEYDGPSDIMIIEDSDEHMGAWEKMQKRLSGAPIIQGILGKSHEVFEKSGAREVKERMDDIKHDATEAWETSQNPWVYRISSVYDTMTAETDMAIATRELQKLDPQFTMEQFKVDAVEHTLPEIMGKFLEGRIQDLEPWLGEAVFKRLSAESQVRKEEGLVLDSNLLGIFNAEIVAVEMDKVERQPIILLHYMCQQINCVRNKDGEVVEGKEDDIKANSYLVAFQRQYDEKDSALNWKIVDFRFNGAIAWI